MVHLSRAWEAELSNALHAKPVDSCMRDLLVDDGAATGATMLAAVHAARKLDAKKVIVALPVASIDAHRMLAKEADEVICVSTPPAFYAVGQWYEEFSQTSDAEVTELLARASHMVEENAR